MQRTRRAYSASLFGGHLRLALLPALKIKATAAVRAHPRERLVTNSLVRAAGIKPSRPCGGPVPIGSPNRHQRRHAIAASCVMKSLLKETECTPSSLTAHLLERASCTRSRTCWAGRWQCLYIYAYRETCTVYIQISKTKENVHTVAYLSDRSSPQIFFS